MTDLGLLLEPLRSLRSTRGAVNVVQAFASNASRFEQFSASASRLLLDWSKCQIDADIMGLLFDVARARPVQSLRDAMFAGEPINLTENRAVLHTALRARHDQVIFTGGHNVVPGVLEARARMAAFASAVRTGSIQGATGQPFSDVVNIGIGGSDLGPAMVARALEPYRDGPRLHYVSNVDSADGTDTLKILDPATTLFIVASKTFTTVETLTNAQTARDWVSAALGTAAVADHFVAISTAPDKVAAFGISADRTFGFSDWVGGRYSVWSAIGLSVMIGIGEEEFGNFLAGAAAMDAHFKTAPFEANLPVIMGLLGIFHRNVCGFGSHAIIPYDQRLGRLPAYLQQLDMESNGKSVTREGLPVPEDTGPVVWGEPGTNGQHAFFQLLHQGTSTVPVDFLIGARSHEPGLDRHQQILMANCLAQSEALMRGRSLEDTTTQLIKAGHSAQEAATMAPPRTFPGNRPSTTLIYETLDPATLGEIIALHEHRVFVEAALWNINAFDQFGVELGKELATRLLPLIDGSKAADGSLDGSTAGLLAALGAWRARPA